MTEKIKVLVVGARRNGYRRAGLQFGESAASIPLSALTSHQVKELRTDRMLATHETDAVVLVVTEFDELQRRAAIGEELVALLPVIEEQLVKLLPADSVRSCTPAEYIANLVEQLRVQTERANGLQGDKEALRTQLAELEAKHAVKPDAAKVNASKPSHGNGSR